MTRLILVCLPAFPEVSLKGKENKKYNEANHDLIKMGKDDIKALRKNFPDSIVCNTLIYLGVEENHKNGFGNVLTNLIEGLGENNQIDEIAINITGHGTLNVIGSIEADDKIDSNATGIANKVYEDIKIAFEKANILPCKGIHFYIRSCNSGYPDPEERGTETYDSEKNVTIVEGKTLEETLIENSFAGIFALRLRRIMQEDELNLPVRVSGFIGYMGDSSISSTLGKKKTIPLSNCRTTFESITPISPLEIINFVEGKIIDQIDPVPQKVENMPSEDSLDNDYNPPEVPPEFREIMEATFSFRMEAFLDCLIENMPEEQRSQYSSREEIINNLPSFSDEYIMRCAEEENRRFEEAIKTSSANTSLEDERKPSGSPNNASVINNQNNSTDTPILP